MNGIGRICDYQSVRVEELANSLRVLLKPAYQKQPRIRGSPHGGSLARASEQWPPTLAVDGSFWSVRPFDTQQHLLTLNSRPKSYTTETHSL